jgi:protein-tyrosine phosphatase
MDAIPHTAGIFWIATRTPGRLAILLRPASGPVLQATVEDWHSAGIETVVCLMEEGELRSLGIEREGDVCREAGLEFIALPIVDFGVPGSTAEIAPVLREIAVTLRRGSRVGIHCRQSVGRSGLLACSLLVALGFEPIEAFHTVSKSRGVSVPETSEQRRWIEAAKPALRALGL